MKLNNILIDTSREPTGEHITTAKEHGHTFDGVEITFILEPPFIEVVPLVTVGEPPEEGPMSQHQHELVDLPSIEAVEEEIIPPYRFSEHSHSYEAEGIGIEGPETISGTLMPPPIPF
jgi:hypothetical protein